MQGIPFKPPWWLKNPHLQTLWASLIRRPVKNLVLTRERLELPDGDFLDLEWTNNRKQGPIIVILHGFEGSIDSHYAKGMLQAIVKKNWRGLFMHFRGCSGEPNRLAHSYHSGETGDIATLISELKKREPNTPIAAIGFSLGGNVLLKWLGETGANNPLSAAIAVCVPFELKKAVGRIGQGFSKIYQWYFLQCLRKRLEFKFSKTPRPSYLPAYFAFKTLPEFDDKVTAPLHGFSDHEDYYSKASSRAYLKTIQVPTLIVHAKDDPFMTEDIIPDMNEISDKVFLEVTESGGHVGFVMGDAPWKVEYWLEHRLPVFLQEYI